MSIFKSMHISTSALTAQRLRMDVVSSNIANAQTTRATLNEDGTYDPYRRKLVVLEAKDQSFRSFLQKAKTRQKGSQQGVYVREIREDESPFKLQYNPNHPDADEAGYVQLPNVDPLHEMVDLMGATRSYEANVTAINASKNMLLKALEIGK